MAERNSKTKGGAGSDRERHDWRHLSRLFEKLPPHATEAEMSLLGSVLIDPQVIGDVVMVLTGGDDFYKPANGTIYDAMVELYNERSTLDIVQLHQLLVDRGTLDAVGGLDYLVELADAVPSASNVVHYARLVREKSKVRELIGAAGEILYDAYHSPEDGQVILEQAEQRIFHIAQQSDKAEIESLGELIQEAMELISANEGRHVSGIETGFVELDEMTHGLQRGELIILAARPSMGKTALALNLAETIGLRRKAVGVFSLEMGRQQLVQRLLAARSGVNSQRLRRGMLNKDEHRALIVACDEMLDAPVYIDDTPGLTLLQLRAEARRMVARHKVEVLMIDYLQLLTIGGRSESRQVEVSEISRGIKAMARELEVPVLCLSQLNRAAEQREGHKPRLSDLRESGSIEQDADVVAMLHREEYYHQANPEWAEENPDRVGLAELIIAKQRNGPTGSVKLTWVAECTRFRDYSPAPPPSEYREPKTYTPKAVATDLGDLPV